MVEGKHINNIKADAIEEMAKSLITGSVANHWCEKEQAGYMWCHDAILEHAKQLRNEVNDDTTN